MRRSRLRGPAVVVLALAAHGALLVGAGRPQAPVEVARKLGGRVVEPAARVERAARVAEDRAILVASARDDLREGKLALGEFLLRANALDAEERGAALDLEAARGLYRARVEALRAALARGSLRDAAPEVFADLRYFGRPGGLMADALFDRGGSCEQLAHLVAAAAHDAGLPGQVALRFYGGVMSDGAAHLAPVEGSGAGELDLFTGRPAFRRGTRFPATDLVEAYARAHGLAPPLVAARLDPPAQGSAGAAASDAEPGRPSLAAGYPPNADRYPGTLPLYAARAVAEPADDDGTSEGGALEQRSRAHDCAFFVRMAALDPPTIEIDPAGSRVFRVELRRVPAPSELERKAALLRGAEDIAAGDKVDPTDRLMAYACVAALSRDLAWDFALAGEIRLAELSLHKESEIAARGAGAIAAVAWEGAEGAEIERRLEERFAGQTWLLLFLDGGDRPVFDLARRTARAAGTPGSADWGQVEVLAALAVAPATRARAYEILRDLPRRAQVEVMHEVFHAHDHLRPWASSYTLDGDGARSPSTAEGREFRSAYRVFRGLASRLWEGQRPVDQTIAALTREAREAGLDPEWEGLFLEYYVKNMLGLQRGRPGGLEVVRLLEQAVDAGGHPALEPLRQLLDAAEARGRTLYAEGAQPVL
jgi:hypothetical protein